MCNQLIIVIRIIVIRTLFFIIIQIGRVKKEKIFSLCIRIHGSSYWNGDEDREKKLKPFISY